MMDKEKVFAEMEGYIKACHDNYRSCFLCPKGKECVIPRGLIADNPVIFKPFTWLSFKRTRQTELGKFLFTVKSICDDSNGDCSKCPLKYTHDFPVRSDCTFAHKPLYWLYAPVESKMADVINEVNKKEDKEPDKEPNDKAKAKAKVTVQYIVLKGYHTSCMLVNGDCDSCGLKGICWFPARKNIDYLSLLIPADWTRLSYIGKNKDKRNEAIHGIMKDIVNICLDVSDCLKCPFYKKHKGSKKGGACIFEGIPEQWRIVENRDIINKVLGKETNTDVDKQPET